MSEQEKGYVFTFTGRPPETTEQMQQMQAQLREGIKRREASEREIARRLFGARQVSMLMRRLAREQRRCDDGT